MFVGLWQNDFKLEIYPQSQVETYELVETEKSENGLS